MTRYIADSNFDPALLAGAHCAFGVFDGVHQGHRYLIDQAIAGSRENGGKSCVITFDTDPDEMFHPKRLKKLMRNADRLNALEASGVDYVVVLPFTAQLASLPPDDFLEQLFGDRGPASLHVGEDFRFGAKASGTVDDLRRWADRLGDGSSGTPAIHPHSLISADGDPITATRIRLLLLNGKVQEANRLLGHPYRLRETVRPGRGEGATMGFATANLKVRPHDRVLGEGVYGAVAIVDGRRYKAAVSVGVSPTFQAESTANMEVHILDFDGDLTGRDITVEFLDYLRPMMKFPSTEALIAQVKKDIETVRAMDVPM